IVLGGPEVSFEGTELFDRHPGVSALVTGEGEEPLERLLSAWRKESQPKSIPRTIVRQKDQLVLGPKNPPLNELDAIPSPIKLGLTDLNRGFVYYETSRGCPFHCSFCLSARDNQMRSFSMERIQSDLRILMDSGVDKVKLVDRTFNYDPRRAQEIFSFILGHNRSTHFHFEIGAHLLDDETLDLLATVPADMFQFEIGVQSTLESTLDAIDRKVNLDKLEANVRRLIDDDRIHLHLDLVAGLPGDTYVSFKESINRVIALQPQHLQIEPVKLLLGSPLRDQAKELQIHFDPNPPYTILDSPYFPYEDLKRIQDISRLLDLTYNSGCFGTFLQEVAELKGSFADGLAWISEEWRKRGLFRFPMNRQTIFYNLADIVHEDGRRERKTRNY
ncbi:MAG: DUF4080 domain-containing protein, partial [Gammaproteobacteria bacterium]|nr:DUF4080 domain-containing protein [Gammaproteobacteria bacterium]NIS27479.1 DUF4080 domain-containing protein [candidate division KSB1 bacterium]NIQ11722.1 DUF4080 domain-containing protein [Gammaproteobacteria bacterium]NIR27671.1 DUF4080 domain-containing protein [Gammaproteobacteria bacterium]NIW72637.1 DUF4080 domain-containing protein [candidate division KSB1 bacterium]